MNESTTPSPAPAGLLVDYGGVLTTSIHDSFGTFCVREGIDPEAFRDALSVAFSDADSPAARIEVGAIDAHAFDSELARYLSDGCGRLVSPEGLVRRMFAGIRREPIMVEAIRRIRLSGVTTVLLSNSWGGAAYEDEVIELLFDHAVVSGKVGMRKPNADIYEYALGLAGLDAASCVFIDDLPLNCQGAEHVGIAAIHHVEPRATLATLEVRFAVPLGDLIGNIEQAS